MHHLISVKGCLSGDEKRKQERAADHSNVMPEVAIKIEFVKVFEAPNQSLVHFWKGFTYFSSCVTMEDEYELVTLNLH